MSELLESTPDTDIKPVSAPAESDIVSARRPNKLPRVALAALAITVAASNSETVVLYSDLGAKNATTFMRDINPLESEPDPTTPESMEYRFGVKDGLYTSGEYGNYASIWSHSGVIEAYWTVHLTDQDANYSEKYQQALEASNYYWDNGSRDGMPGYEAYIPAPLINESDRFVDDNLWLGLILAREHKYSGDMQALGKAQNIFDLAIDQWDHERGGIYWQVQRSDVRDNTRAIVSNAPAIQLGVMLYQITGQQRYLTESEQIFEWIKQLKDVDEQTYNDHMKIDGSLEFSKWTYVQGVVTGAKASLHSVDPEKYSLEDAVELAETTLDAYKNGRIMVSPEFDAILFHNLLWVAWHYQNPEFTEEVKAVLNISIDNMPEKHYNLLATAGSIRLRTLAKLNEENYQYLF